MTVRYVATCRRCQLEVSVENQAALDEVSALLEAGEGCRTGSGHHMTQVLPPSP